MTWFLGGIAFLVLGYLVYGRIVERLLGPDDRKTPAVANPDGVDVLPLPEWKNMLIQLLNIAGIGPVIGVILGIKFGKIALLIIPVGCVFMGAVHDFAAGMMSLRMNGANLPKIVERNLGRTYSAVFSWIMLVLLLLVVAVFINVPANLIGMTFGGANVFWWAVGAIFAYYVAATLFPVDKIIGRVYPLFGALLVVGSVAISVALVAAGLRDPAILNDCAGFADFQSKNPLFPCLFVTIACGIISGFHATQSPIVARTMTSERQARATFFGMMIAEGVIAMIWAAAALAIYNTAPENLALAGPKVLGNITTRYLGQWMGGVTVFAIVVLAVTSGDTALRSARLSLAEMFGIDQVKLPTRIMTCTPLILAVALLLWWSNQSAKSFANLWNYFAWGNQMLSATTLMAATVWLVRQGRRAASLVTLIPGMFMTSVIVAFILWTPGTGGQPWGLVPGGLPVGVASAIAAAVSVAFAAFAIRRGRAD
ncbi:MAG: carbon starvation protein A [Kiritimatiellae bacterium]|nr:carbon starvation protein A [Kiritimatiellia bacterium]